MFRQSFLAACGFAALAGCATAPPFASNEALGVVTIAPFAETAPVASAHDAADDPAIWANPSDPARSRILGTDKQAGLYVYDLAGVQTQFLPVGDLNNVDLRTVPTPSGPRHIAAATNRTNNAVSLFEIDPETATVTSVGEYPVDEPEVYGFCLGLDSDGSLLAFTNTKTAKVVVHRIRLSDMRAEHVADWSFGGQMEGCAHDDDAQALFLGEEEYGLWRVSHKDGVETERNAVDTVAADKGLVMDVEGVDIWTGENGAGYVVVSAQAADRFIVYDRAAPHAILGRFGVGPSVDGGIDGVSHTDGLAVTSAPLGDALPAGLLVVQDDANTDPAEPQNFKLVDWRSVAAVLAAETP